MSAPEVVKQNIGRIHHKLNSSPLLSCLLSILVGGMFLAASLVQIQTSEALVLGSPQVTGPAWGTLNQFWLLASGQAPAQLSTAWIYAWIVEIITLVFAINLAVAVAKISSVNPHIGKGFVILGIVLVGLNSWADYASGPGSNLLVHFLVALAIGGMAVVGLPLCVGLFEHAIEEF